MISTCVNVPIYVSLRRQVLQEHQLKIRNHNNHVQMRPFLSRPLDLTNGRRGWGGRKDNCEGHFIDLNHLEEFKATLSLT